MAADGWYIIPIYKLKKSYESIIPCTLQSNTLSLPVTCFLDGVIYNSWNTLCYFRTWLVFKGGRHLTCIILYIITYLRPVRSAVIWDGRRWWWLFTTYPTLTRGGANIVPQQPPWRCVCGQFLFIGLVSAGGGRCRFSQNARWSAWLISQPVNQSITIYSR